jgi:hypothetical protein
LPDEACPTMAKLRISAGGCGAMLLKMKLGGRACKLRERLPLLAVIGNRLLSVKSVACDEGHCRIRPSLQEPKIFPSRPLGHSLQVGYP